MITIFALIIPILFLFLYITFFSFELAAVFEFWKPELFQTRFSIAPVWEITNVFLVFALVSFIAFFPGELSSVAPRLTIPAFLFLTVQAIRIGCMMRMLYGKNHSRFSKNLLVTTSILAPAILIGGTIPLFLFQNFSSVPAIVLAIIVGIFTASAMSATAILFLRARKNPNDRWNTFAWIFFQAVLWALFAAFVLATKNETSIASVMTDPATAKMLLIVCAGGIVVTVPGVIIAYKIFL